MQGFDTSARTHEVGLPGPGNDGFVPTPSTPAPQPRRRLDVKRWLPPALMVLLAVAALYLTTLVYAAGETLLAGTVLVVVALAAWIYSSSRTYAFRYLFPGIAAAVIFVVFPMLYTMAIGFTNYSSRNLLTFERATRFLLDETRRAEGPSYALTLHADGREYRGRLEHEDGTQAFVTAPLALSKSEALEVDVQLLQG